MGTMLEIHPSLPLDILLSKRPNSMAYFHAGDPNSDPSSKVVDVFEKVGSAQARWVGWVAQSWCGVGPWWSNRAVGIANYFFPKHEERLSSNDQLLQGHLSLKRSRLWVQRRSLWRTWELCLTNDLEHYMNHLRGIFRKPYHPLKANKDI